MDTLMAFQNMGIVEGFVTIVAWFCLFVFVYGLVKIYNKFS